MISLARFRPTIAAKAAVLIAGLGLVSTLADWFTLDSVEKLERLSANVSEHLSPARLALAEAKTMLSELGIATYKAFAATEPDTVNQAGRDIADQYAAANNSLSNGLSYFPQRADDFNRLRDKLALVVEIANEAQGARAARERERAQNILDLKLEPALDDAMFQLNRLINILGGEIQVALADAAAERARTLNNMLAILIGGTLLTVITAMALAHRLVALPLQRLTDHVIRIRTSGTLAVQTDDRLVGRNDEIGAMARATESFRDNLVRMRALEAKQKEIEARTAADIKAADERDVAQRKAAAEQVAAEKQAAMHKLASQFQAAVGKIVNSLSSASTELEAAAGTLTQTAEVTQRLSGLVAGASSQASENVQRVASATDEMTTSVNEIGCQMRESSRIATEAVAQAAKTDARIAALSQSAGRIGDVVKLITAIAAQTNLLALNATIEAASLTRFGHTAAAVRRPGRWLGISPLQS